MFTKTTKLIGITTTVLIVMILILWQPWQKKQMVLSANLPHSARVIELWEKPYWCIGLRNEYETWLVIKSPNKKEKWSMIDKKYIEFRRVTLLISADFSKIRVETNGKSSPAHMIAEYDLKNESIRIKSEESVKGKEGWIAFKEQVVR